MYYILIIILLIAPILFILSTLKLVATPYIKKPHIPITKLPLQGRLIDEATHNIIGNEHNPYCKCDYKYNKEYPCKCYLLA